MFMKARMMERKAVFIQNDCQFHSDGNKFPIVPKPPKLEAPSFVKTEIEVKNLAIISGISEHHLIEIVGTLVDNAYEACTPKRNQVFMELDSEEDRMVFVIRNQMEDVTMGELHQFFSKGFSRNLYIYIYIYIYKQ